MNVAVHIREDGVLCTFSKPEIDREEINGLLLSPYHDIVLTESPEFQFRQDSVPREIVRSLPIKEAWWFIAPEAYPWRLWGYCFVDVIVPESLQDWEDIAKRAANYLLLGRMGSVRLIPLAHVVRAAEYFGVVGNGEDLIPFSEISPPVLLDIYVHPAEGRPRYAAFLETKTRRLLFIYPLLPMYSQPAQANPICLLPALGDLPGQLCAFYVQQAAR